VANTNTIKRQRQLTSEWPINQNGRHSDFYPGHDWAGRIAGATKQGIVTIPDEMTPRQRLVDKSESIAANFKPKNVSSATVTPTPPPTPPPVVPPVGDDDDED